MNHGPRTSTVFAAFAAVFLLASPWTARAESWTFYITGVLCLVAAAIQKFGFKD